MATNPEQPALPGDPKKPVDTHYDESTGVYGFFRRHQKTLLYTAGLFTLLTFSITGPMMALVEEIFGTNAPMPTIEVGGQQVTLEPEDYHYGRLLARNVGTAVPLRVLPRLHPGDGKENQLLDVFAILRRAAIAEGIEPSFDDVDAAIEAERERFQAPSAARMARDRGFDSLAHYRTVFAEAMRIGTYVRLQTLALDASDARVLSYATSDRDKVTMRVAVLDEKQLEETLKQGKTLGDEELRTWLDGKNEMQKQQLQAYGLPRAELRFAGLLLAEGQFDPAQWQDGYLKDFTVTDDQLQNLYNAERETRFKLENGEYRPFDDAAVKAELTRLIQAEHVMNQLLAAVRQQQQTALQALTDEVARAQGELGPADASVRELEQAAAIAKSTVEAKEKELAAQPDDAALTAAVATAKAELATAENALFQAKEKVPSLQAAVDAATTALQDARAQFDFLVPFLELTKDKSGVVTKTMTGMKTGEEMKDLDALGLDLGTWPGSVQGAALRTKGDIGFAPARSSKAVFLYQASDVEPRPLKPWETLKPLAEGAYWTEQAKKAAEEQKQKMEAALLRLAKEKMPERVTELEAQKTKRVDDRLAEWETQTRSAIEQAEKTLAGLPAGTKMHENWQQELNAQQAELAQKEQRRAAFETEVTQAITNEIATEAKKHYGDVLDAAAAEAGFTVVKLGPYARDLQQRTPRFDKAFDPAVVYLWRTQSQLKAGEATGVLQDATNRAWYVAVATDVEPVTAGDVARRDFESLRTGDGVATFGTQQAYRAFRTAFTLDALEARYDLQRRGELREQTATRDAEPR